MAYTLGKIIGIILIIYIISKIFGGGKKSTDAKDAGKPKTTTASTQPKKSTPKTSSTPKKPANRWAGKVSHATPHLDEMPTDGTWDDAYDYIQYLLTINNSLPAGAETKAAKNDFKLKGFAQYLSQMVTKLWDDAQLIDFGDNDKVVEVKFYVAADAVLQLLGTRNGIWFVDALHFSSFRDKYDKIAAAHPEIPMGPSFARLSSKAEVKWLGELIAKEAENMPALEYYEFLTYDINADKCGQMEAFKAEKERKATQAEVARKSAPKKPSGSTGGAKKKPAASDSQPKSDLEAQMQAMLTGGSGKSADAKKPDAPKSAPKKPDAPKDEPKKDAGAEPSPMDIMGERMRAILDGLADPDADMPAPEKPVEPETPAEPEKPAEPPKPKKPKGPSKAQIDGLMGRIIDYYAEMWNPKTGSLYKELDVSMPIDHFSIQLKTDRLVDSVWLSGDELPLVSETAYTDLPGASELTNLPKSVKTTALQTALIGLGTVTYDEQNDLYYPIHKKTPQEPPKADGKSARKPMSDLEAQMQAMLDRDKKK